MTDYTIPAENMARLETKLTQINKKAIELGFAPVVLIIIADHYTPISGNPEVKQHWIKISVVGETPVIDGWKFIGTLDHKSIEGDVLLRPVPGETIPAQFHNSDTTCDHCNQKRLRNKTFILEKENEFMRVGSSCVIDFIGHDPHAATQWLTILWSVFDEMDDFEKSENITQVYETSKLLEVTAAIIREFGWISKGDATENMLESTTHTVSSFLFGNTPEDQKLRESISVETQDIDLVKAMMIWVDDQEANSDYMINVKKIGGARMVGLGSFGIACSIVGIYIAAMKKLKKTIVFTDEYVGEIKTRQDMTLTVLFKKYIDGVYGTTTMHKFIDDSGRMVIWFASGFTDLEEGTTYVVKATIKKHDTYNNVKQTIVNRVTVIS